jgi:2-polyprenyl-3-methyl-5-hydroxy-6-metoxy-1,4-benzoquinol methylase
VPSYGSHDYFEQIYGASQNDPWGLTWRPTQLYRYGRMLDGLARCMREMGADRSGELIDIGCATGEFTNLLRTHLAATGRVVGVDVSETAVQRAASRFPSIQFEAGGIDETALRHPGTADVVTCLEVIYYVRPDQRRAALAKIKSMLRPGGMLLISSMTGPAPYLDALQLGQLVASEFTTIGGGTLSLRPLVDVEKLLLKLRRPRRARDLDGFLPGQRAFSRIDRLAKLCSSVFGAWADSHAFVVARA